MALFAQYSGDNWKVALWQIEESVDDMLSLIELDENRLKEILILPREARKLEKLIANHLVNLLSNSKAQIGYSSTGAPYIKGSDLNISITHTKGWIAVQTSRDVLPGIDVEYKSDRVLKVAHKFVSNSEMVYADNVDKVLYFNILWCAKEALYKIAQKEGAIFMDDFFIEPFLVQTSGFLKGRILLLDGILTVGLQYIVGDEWYLVFRI